MPEAYLVEHQWNGTLTKAVFLAKEKAVEYAVKFSGIVSPLEKAPLCRENPPSLPLCTTSTIDFSPLGETATPKPTH